MLDAAGGRTDPDPDGLRDAIPDHLYRPRDRGPVLPHRALDRDRHRHQPLAHHYPRQRHDALRCRPGEPDRRPRDPARIFSWQICRSWDDKGNAAVYSYIAEDSAGIDADGSARGQPDTADACRADLPQDGPATATSSPTSPTSSGDSEQETPFPADWMFSVVLDYGDHASAPPTPKPDQPWPVRPDPFSTYRARFEVRTYRRVQRLLFFNNFPDEPTAGADCLVRSLDLVYSDQQTPADPRNPRLHVPRLRRRRPATGRAARAWSPGPCRRWSSSYSQPQIQQRGPDPRPGQPGQPARRAWTASRFRWVDLDGEGLSGILSDAGGGWYYKRNLSAGNLITQARRDAGRAGPLRAAGDRVPRCRPAPTCPGCGCSTCPASGRLDVVDLADPILASSSGPKTAASSRCSDSQRCRTSTGRTRTSSSST